MVVSLQLYGDFQGKITSPLDAREQDLEAFPIDDSEKRRKSKKGPKEIKKGIKRQ